MIMPLYVSAKPVNIRQSTLKYRIFHHFFKFKQTKNRKDRLQKNKRKPLKQIYLPYFFSCMARGIDLDYFSPVLYLIRPPSPQRGIKNQVALSHEGVK